MFFSKFPVEFFSIPPHLPPSIPLRTNAVNRVFDRQAQPIPSELTAKLLGNRVAVSPIVTVEPRRRKFHKPITLTLPLPQAAAKGMINHYTGDAPTLRLLCSITGKRPPLLTPASPGYTITTRRYSPPFSHHLRLHIPIPSGFFSLLSPPAPLFSFFFLSTSLFFFIYTVNRTLCTPRGGKNRTHCYETILYLT